MKKSESKYFNTALKMNDALISLLNKKDFEYITIKEICDLSKVNRSTFYLHYENTFDLLQETIDNMNFKLEEKFKNIDIVSFDELTTCPLENLLLISPKYIMPYLEFIKENKCVYQVAKTKPDILQIDKVFKNKYQHFLYPIMKRFGVPDNEIVYKLKFYFGGMFSVVTEWIKNDFKDSIEDVSKILYSCIMPNIIHTKKD